MPHKYTFAQFILALTEWRPIWKSLTYRKDVSIPDAWRSYKNGHEAFTRDVLRGAGLRPKGAYDLARVDQAKGYESGNLEWVPSSTAGVRANTKLTDADVRTIRERRASGDAPCDLARIYKVTPGHIVNICTGRTRREAGGPIQSTEKE